MSTPASLARSAIPTIATLLVLVGIGWWGHHTGWKAAPRSASASEAAPREDWCSEHNVPESTCLLCKKPLAKALIAKEPAAYRAPGEEVRFSQLASEEVLAKVGITTAKAEASDVEPSVDVPAETAYDPSRVTRLTSRIPGLIQAVSVHLGDAVTAQDVVAIIESAEVGKAKSELMRAIGEQGAAAAVAKRVAASSQAGFRTAAEAQEAEARLRAARVNVFDAEQMVLNLGLAVSADGLADLEPSVLSARLRGLGLPPAMAAVARSANLLPVLAPRAGTVSELHAIPGESLEAGAPIAVIADTASVWVTFQLPPEVAATITPGRPIRFHPNGGEDVSGRVMVVSSAADEGTRLVPVSAAIDNPGSHLRVNQFGRVTIATGESRKAVVLPPEAVQFDGGTAYVFVRRSPTIFRGLPVPILARTPAGIAVGRLLPGDEVAVTGTAMLKGNLFQDKFGADDD
jgi:cobalt-zinc-cadmium efflux system membrane fusion protein